MLIPARTKYRKSYASSNTGHAKGGDFLAFGDCGIQALGWARMTSAQIEAARVAINRQLKRRGKVFIRVFPHRPVTARPAETRMGKGKGAVDHWVAMIKPGVILFEVSGISPSLARQAFRLADNKLPFPCRFIERES